MGTHSVDVMSYTLRDRSIICRNGIAVGRVVRHNQNFVGIIGEYDDNGKCLKKYRQGPPSDDCAIAFAEVVARYQGYKDGLTMAQAHKLVASSPSPSKIRWAEGITV